jgi:hypothetical protein
MFLRLESDIRELSPPDGLLIPDRDRLLIISLVLLDISLKIELCSIFFIDDTFDEVISDCTLCDTDFGIDKKAGGAFL